MGYVLGQLDKLGRKGRAVYCLSKNFLEYESKYMMLEKTCFDSLACLEAQTLHALLHYLANFSDGSPYISVWESNPIKSDNEVWDLANRIWYRLQHREGHKGQITGDHLANNPTPGSQDLFLPDYYLGHWAQKESHPNWKLYFDGAVNVHGNGTVQCWPHQKENIPQWCYNWSSLASIV